MSRKNWAMIYHLGFGYPYYYPVLYTGTFTTSSATVPADTGAGAIYGNSYFDGCILMPLSGVCAYQPRKILSFATTTGVFTMDSAFTAAIGTVQYMILIDTADSGGATTTAGKTQIKATTIDLHQAAGAKDLFTGTTQDVLIKSLTFRLPDIDVSDDAAITGISIQTDDTTPQVFINSVVGAKAYLTAEAQLGWTGAALLKSGNKIQLTIIGGTATADPTTCDVVCEFEAVVSGGYLA